MNVGVFAGIVVMLFGSIVFTGEKSLNLHSPALGVLLIGAGFLLAIYSYFNVDAVEKRGPRRRVSDNSV